MADKSREFMGCDYIGGPMWLWFNLSYAAYLVLPRRLICEMPNVWQKRLVELLDEFEAMLGDYLSDGDLQTNYQVTLRKRGRYITDPLRNYRHPGPI